MAHNYQKRWVFIWNADENDKLIDSRELENLMNKIVKEGVFQLEKRKRVEREYTVVGGSTCRSLSFFT